MILYIVNSGKNTVLAERFRFQPAYRDLLTYARPAGFAMK